MSVPQITPLPTPPSRGRPAEFSDEADGFLGAMPDFGEEANILAAFVNGKAQEAADIVANAGLVATSSTELTIGAGSKSLTIQTGRAFGVGTFVAISQTGAPTTNYMTAQVTAHNRDTGALTVLVVRTEGSGTYTDWTIGVSGPPGNDGSDADVTEENIATALGGAPLLEDAAADTYAALTDAFVDIAGTTYTILASDLGKVLRFTSGTAVTVTLPNNLPAGWNCVWRQVGAGQITFSPASGATLDHFLDHTKSAGQKSEGTLAVDENTDSSSAVYYLGGATEE